MAYMGHYPTFYHRFSCGLVYWAFDILSPSKQVNQIGDDQTRSDAKCKRNRVRNHGLSELPFFFDSL